jgi:hypothetical protein
VKNTPSELNDFIYVYHHTNFGNFPQDLMPKFACAVVDLDLQYNEQQDGVDI